MSLRQRAIDAHLADEQSYRDRARQALAAIGITQADGLRQVGHDIIDDRVRILYGDGDLHLAVILDDDTARVLLVEMQDGQWTRRADVDSLAQLGAALTAS